MGSLRPFTEIYFIKRQSENVQINVSHISAPLQEEIVISVIGGILLEFWLARRGRLFAFFPFTSVRPVEARITNPKHSRSADQSEGGKVRARQLPTPSLFFSKAYYPRSSAANFNQMYQKSGRGQLPKRSGM
jgi:hypothetical protein